MVGKGCAVIMGAEQKGGLAILPAGFEILGLSNPKKDQKDENFDKSHLDHAGLVNGWT